MPAPSLRVEVADGVALTLDRAENLNALDRALPVESGAALDQVQADPTVGALIPTGAGERGLEREAMLSGLACAGLGACPTHGHLLRRCHHSERLLHMRESARAFLEKRPARFRGR